jgi:addiction module RelB/DinJ family antitoxin
MAYGYATSEIEQCMDNVHTLAYTHRMNTVINIRTDKGVRDEAKKVFSKMGLSTSAGINIFLHQVVAEKGLPFVPTADPKKIRARWDAQTAKALKAKKYFSASSALRGL